MVDLFPQRGFRYDGFGDIFTQSFWKFFYNIEIGTMAGRVRQDNEAVQIILITGYSDYNFYNNT